MIFLPTKSTPSGGGHVCRLMHDQTTKWLDHVLVSLCYLSMGSPPTTDPKIIRFLSCWLFCQWQSIERNGFFGRLSSLEEDCKTSRIDKAIIREVQEKLKHFCLLIITTKHLIMQATSPALTLI